MVVPPIPFDKVFAAISDAVTVIPILRTLVGSSGDDPSIAQIVARTLVSTKESVTDIRQRMIDLRETLGTSGIDLSRSLNDIVNDYGFFSKLLHFPTWTAIKKARRAIAASCQSLEEDVADAISVLACMKRQEQIITALRMGSETTARFVGDLNETKMTMPVSDAIEGIIRVTTQVLEELDKF